MSKSTPRTSSVPHLLQLAMCCYPTHRKDEAPARRKPTLPPPMLLHDLPVEMILMIGEHLDDAGIRNFRAVSRAFHHTMYSHFVRFCVAKIRSKPMIPIMPTVPESLARVAAISEIPKVVEAISGLHIRVTLPLPLDELLFVVLACQAFDSQKPIATTRWNFLGYHDNKFAHGRFSRLYLGGTLKTVLGRLVNLRNIRLEFSDLLYEGFFRTFESTAALLPGFWNNAKAVSKSTKAVLSDVLAAVSHVSGRLHTLEITNDADVFPGLYGTGCTKMWNSHMFRFMANLTSLTLVLPAWGLRTASFGQSHNLQGSVIIPPIIRLAPNLEELSLSGTEYACMDPATVSALVAELRPQTLKKLHLTHFITTLRELQQLLSAHSSSLRFLQFGNGALAQGSWVTFLRDFHLKLHLHYFYMWDLHHLQAGGFECVGFPQIAQNSYRERPCEDCAKWDMAEISKRDSMFNKIIRSSVASPIPYNTTDPFPGLPLFHPPTYAMQEYACRYFRLSEKSLEIRKRHKAEFEKNRLQKAKDRLEKL